MTNEKIAHLQIQEYTVMKSFFPTTHELKMKQYDYTKHSPLQILANRQDNH